MTEQGPTFFIGELAERTGVSRDAIREGLRGLSGRTMTADESRPRPSEGLCSGAFTDLVGRVFPI